MISKFFLRFTFNLGIGCLCLLVLWIPGLVWFAVSMPNQVEDTETPVDAIVVLTGGSERLRTGVNLLQEGMAKNLFVSGVWPGTTRRELLHSIGVEGDSRLGRKIELGHIAADTIGNAWETAIQMQERGWTSVRLVTANYHMRRSLLELKIAMPHAVVVPHPVFPGSVMQDGWWRYRGTALLFATEYTKYILAHVRLLLPDSGMSHVDDVARASLKAMRTFLVSETQYP